jgi:hypothetical protein
MATLFLTWYWFIKYIHYLILNKFLITNNTRSSYIIKITINYLFDVPTITSLTKIHFLRAEHESVGALLRFGKCNNAVSYELLAVL